MLKRIISSGMVFFFFFTSIMGPDAAMAQAVFNLPQPGQMVGLSPRFAPAVLKGISVHPKDPLLFDFVVDAGESGLSGQALTDETTRLVKYFLAGLAVPADELWVNLSPVEKDRIMAEPLSHTDAGRELLAQDYILKQITSSLMYPEKDLGREFWSQIYSRAYTELGTTEVPVDAFNKVWIMPDEAVVYQNGNHAFISKQHLKVMLESDYAAAKGAAQGQVDVPMEVARDVMRSVILPVLEKEVNEGKNFAALRQVFHSLILAGWYKNALKASLLGQVYAGTNKVSGIDTDERNAREKVYTQYLQAYQQGVYNYVREEFDAAAQEVMPRKYFAGGADFVEAVKPEMTGNPKDVKASGEIHIARYSFRAFQKFGNSRGEELKIWARFDVPGDHNLPVKDWDRVQGSDKAQETPLIDAFSMQAWSMTDEIRRVASENNGVEIARLAIILMRSGVVLISAKGQASAYISSLPTVWYKKDVAKAVDAVEMYLAEGREMAAVFEDATRHVQRVMATQNFPVDAKYLVAGDLHGVGAGKAELFLAVAPRRLLVSSDVKQFCASYTGMEDRALSTAAIRAKIALMQGGMHEHMAEGRVMELVQWASALRLSMSSEWADAVRSVAIESAAQLEVAGLPKEQAVSLIEGLISKNKKSGIAYPDRWLMLTTALIGEEYKRRVRAGWRGWMQFGVSYVLFLAGGRMLELPKVDFIHWKVLVMGAVSGALLVKVFFSVNRKRQLLNEIKALSGDRAQVVEEPDVLDLAVQSHNFMQMDLNAVYASRFPSGFPEVVELASVLKSTFRMSTVDAIAKTHTFIAMFNRKMDTLTGKRSWATPQERNQQLSRLVGALTSYLRNRMDDARELLSPMIPDKNSSLGLIEQDWDEYVNAVDDESSMVKAMLRAHGINFKVINRALAVMISEAQGDKAKMLGAGYLMDAMLDRRQISMNITEDDVRKVYRQWQAFYNLFSAAFSDKSPNNLFVEEMQVARVFLKLGMTTAQTAEATIALTRRYPVSTGLVAEMAVADIVSGFYASLGFAGKVTLLMYRFENWLLREKSYVQERIVELVREAVMQVAVKAETPDASMHGGIDLGQGDYLKVRGVDAAGMPQFDPAQLMQFRQDLRGLVPVPVGLPRPADLHTLMGATG